MRNSYFIGCSQGGRQGIGAADKYPGDFDGIVAGAPALDFNNLISWRASFYPLTGIPPNPEFVKSDMWSRLIHNAVLEQCDELDGVKDGIIEYPDLCQFDASVLQCLPAVTEDCLSASQVDVVSGFFKPLTYNDGELIYPGMHVGTEKLAVKGLYAGRPFITSLVSICLVFVVAINFDRIGSDTLYIQTQIGTQCHLPRRRMPEPRKT